MLVFLAIILFFLWLAGAFVAHLPDVIHVLLVIALVAFVWDVMVRNRSV